MRAVLFINGLIDDYARTAALLRADDLLICANGGTRHCLALDRVPHVLVGDLDSVAPDQLATLEVAGTHVERHPREKDETDIELALNYAVRAGATQIVLLGALGGRLDQTLANLLILSRAEWQVPILLVEGDQIAFVLHDGKRITFSGQTGAIVSAIPLSEEVTGITYSGLRYKLTDATLPFGSTRGISNEMVGSEATVSIGEGVLLLVTAGRVEEW